MAKTFLTSINLAGNELQNAVVQNLATLPTGVKGQIAFHTATGVNRLAVHDGTAWNTLEYYLAPGTSAQYWRGDKTLATLNTSVVPEGTNLYYTDARVKAYSDTLYLPLSGNAVSATKLQTARAFSITGGATAAAVNFDGTANVALNVTSLSAGSLSGTIPSAVLGNSTMYLGTTALKLNQASGSVVNVTGLNSVQIGSAFLRYDAANNAIYVEGATAGAAVNFYATGEVSAYGAGSGAGGGTGVTSLSALTDVALTSPVSGNVLVYNGTHWENKPQSAIVPDLSAYALKTYVDTAIANLVESAPGTLDTLNELAAALGDDPNFATTVTNQIAGKENAIVAGTTVQYWRGDKTWQTLNTAAVPESGNLYFTTARVLATALTGYAVGANSALAATDTVLSAFGKVQGQLNNKLASTDTAAAATKLATARTFSIVGSTGLSASGISFDGTANVALSLTGVLNTANGGTGLTDAKNGFTRKVVGTFTTSATSYTITHGLGTDVIAQVVTAATPFDVVECDIEMTSSTTTTFRFNVAPAANAYRYIIIG